MKSYVNDAKHLELLTRINQHDRLAGALGILPNHLIQLLRLTNRKELSQIVHYYSRRDRDPPLQQKSRLKVVVNVIVFGCYKRKGAFGNVAISRKRDFLA